MNSYHEKLRLPCLMFIASIFCGCSPYIDPDDEPGKMCAENARARQRLCIGNVENMFSACMFPVLREAEIPHQRALREYENQLRIAKDRYERDLRFYNRQQEQIVADQARYQERKRQCEQKNQQIISQKVNALYAEADFRYQIARGIQQDLSRLEEEVRYQEEIKRREAEEWLRRVWESGGQVSVSPGKGEIAANSPSGLRLRTIYDDIQDLRERHNNILKEAENFSQQAKDLQSRKPDYSGCSTISAPIGQSNSRGAPVWEDYFDRSEPQLSDYVSDQDSYHCERERKYNKGICKNNFEIDFVNCGGTIRR